MNSQGHRGEKLKAGCDDFLALAQPSTSAHQHISTVKGVDIAQGLGEGVSEERSNTMCVYVCMCV